MSWYDTKQAAVDPDNPAANEQFTFDEHNAMVLYQKDKIIDKTVDATAIGNNKVLVYKIATSTFVFEDQSTVAVLGDLTDVTISGVPADNEVLAYDSSTSEFINQTAAEAGLATVAGLASYLALAGGTMSGTLNMGDQLVDDMASIQAYDASGIAVFDSTGVSRASLAYFGTALMAYADIAMGANAITGVADPTNAQDAATKNYADTRLFTKEAVTSFLNGYVPVFRTLSGKFEMENVAIPIFEESANVIRENAGYNNDFVIGSPQLDDDGNTAHDARVWFDKSQGAFRAGTVTGTHWDGVNVGSYSFAEGYDTTASGNYSHAEGHVTVASGYYSHAEGYDTAASSECSHAEGYVTVASGYYSHAEGAETTASGSASHAEGYITVASGFYSHAEGYYAEASGHYSHAEGYYAGAYLYAQHAKAAGRFAATGDAQLSNIVARIETTDATATVEMFLDGSAYRAVLPENRTWGFTINIAARQTGGTAGTVGDSGIYKVEGGIKRDGAGNTALVGSITKTVIAEDQAAWDVTVVADNTNEALVVQVTGEANKTIHWVAAINLVEVG